MSPLEFILSLASTNISPNISHPSYKPNYHIRDELLTIEKGTQGLLISEIKSTKRVVSGPLSITKILFFQSKKVKLLEFYCTNTKCPPSISAPPGRSTPNTAL